jgi:hypothetical protein
MPKCGQGNTSDSDHTDLEEHEVDDQTAVGDDNERDSSTPKRRCSAPASMVSKDSSSREESGCSRTDENSVSWSFQHAVPAAGHKVKERSFPGNRWIWNGAGAGSSESDFNIHASQRSPLPDMATFAQKCSEK